MLGSFAFMPEVICIRNISKSPLVVLQKTLIHHTLPQKFDKFHPTHAVSTLLLSDAFVYLLLFLVFISLHISLRVFQSYTSHQPYFVIIERFRVILGPALLACVFLHTVFVYKYLRLSSMALHFSFFF